MSAYQPKTGAQCSCRPGIQRDNCPRCEGTGMVVDFKAIRERGEPDFYKAEFPLCDDMSPITYNVRGSGMETKEQEALWHYNHSRAHDGLPPLDELPDGVTFTPVWR